MRRPLLILFFLLSTQPIAAAEEISVESVLISVIYEADIPAQDAGVLTELNVREGDEVEAGNRLAKLDDRDLAQQLELARLQWKMAQAESANDVKEQIARKTIEVAVSELKRAQEANLKFAEAVSQTEVDRLQLIAEKSRLNLLQAEHEHEMLNQQVSQKMLEREMAEANLERRTIRAPIPGTVVLIEHQLGEWVQPGDTVLRIIDTSRLRAEATLPARFRNDLLQGCRVEVTLPFSSDDAKPLKGAVQFVHPEIDPVDGSFRVWAEIENPDGLLRAGDTVPMKIFPDQKVTPASDSKSPQ